MIWFEVMKTSLQIFSSFGKVDHDIQDRTQDQEQPNKETENALNEKGKENTENKWFTQIIIKRLDLWFYVLFSWNAPSKHIYLIAGLSDTSVISEH